MNFATNGIVDPFGAAYTINLVIENIVVADNAMDSKLFLFMCGIRDVEKVHKKEKLTIHCIIGDNYVFDHKVDGISCSEWIDNAIGGKIQRVGLDLL